MSPDEKEVLEATLRFYAAIEDLVDGRGAGTMRDTWHHTSRVTSAHPLGDWTVGWDQVAATWDVFASFGKKGNGGTQIRDVKVYLYGDVAYTTSVFVASAAFGGAQLNCTNVLHRVDGVWKIIHHHPDKAPSMEKSLEKMASE
jgi:ketosteroid isomerase-like protein